MTEQEKKLMCKDICARLPYGLKGRDCFGKTRQMVVIYDTGTILAQETDGVCCSACGFVPYLRPMLNMTKDEETEFEETLQYTQYTLESYDWLNSHHFDYRGLIGMGLALEAPEGMY